MFYSTHILPDVEMTCDRVAMVFAGRTSAWVRWASCCRRACCPPRWCCSRGRAGCRRCPRGRPPRQTRRGRGPSSCARGADVDAFLKAALAAGAQVLSVSPRRESLEDFFIREARPQAAAGAGRPAA